MFLINYDKPKGKRMYLSFIQDKIQQHEEQIDNLRELEETIEMQLDALTDEIRDEMLSRLSEKIDEIITDYNLDDPFCETSTEMQEAFSDFVRMNI